MPATDPADASQPPPAQALSRDDFEKLNSVLARCQRGLELGAFPFFRSQPRPHLNSGLLLRTLPLRSARTLVSASEDSPGLMDVGDNLALVFSLRPFAPPSPASPPSRNPAAAAAGLRAILTLGTRPMASAYLLPADSPAQIRQGAIDPLDTVDAGGDAFWLSLLRHDQVRRGCSQAPGDAVFCIGPAGSALASWKSATLGVEAGRGTEQAGAPPQTHPERAVGRELLVSGAVVLGVADSGGADASAGAPAIPATLGIEVDLDRMPRGNPSPTPVEILLGESEEHLLIVVRKGREDDVKGLLDRWDLPTAEVGRLTESGRFVVRNRGQVVADLPVNQLPGGTGTSLPEPREPEYLAATRAFTLASLPDTEDPARDLKTILGDPAFASKRWVCSQATPASASETVPSPILDTAVFSLSEDMPPRGEGGLAYVAQQSPRGRHIGLAVGGNGSYAHLDPYAAGKIAVAEAARNLACAGGSPLSTVTTVRLGDALQPETAWQWQEFARALAEGCQALNAPITGGRVLFADTDRAGAGELVPTLAMAGLLPQVEVIPTPWFKDPGDVILLLGDLVELGDPLLGLGGSAYLRLVRHMNAGAPPGCDFEKERELDLALRAFISSGVVKSAHDCGEGGIALALLESCAARPAGQARPESMGAQVDLTAATAAPTLAPDPTETPTPAGHARRLDASLFGEGQARVVISVAPLDAAKVLAQARILGVPAARIGTVGGAAFQVKAPGGELNCGLAELCDLWWKGRGRVWTESESVTAEEGPSSPRLDVPGCRS